MTNSWNAPFQATEADFLSVDTTGLRGPRKPDGSLPDLPFLHLVQGSDLIDAGTDVGLPFNGPAPDLGAFEAGFPNGADVEAPVAHAFALFQNYPNPLNPATTISFSLPSGGRTRLGVIDLLGREVKVVFDGILPSGVHSVRWSAADLPSGAYFYRLRQGERSAVRKLVILR
jgi:hypothetical protein